MWKTRACGPETWRSKLLPDVQRVATGPFSGAFFMSMAVMASRWPSQRMACSRLLPHISSDGCREPQTAGRSGWPKSLHRRASSRWGQGTPAGLPWGSPGSGELMEGAMQQAAQAGRQRGRSMGGIVRLGFAAQALRSTPCVMGCRIGTGSGGGVALRLDGVDARCGPADSPSRGKPWVKWKVAQK